MRLTINFTIMKIEFKWAVIISATLLAFLTVEMLLGWHDENIDRHAKASMIYGMVIPAAGILLGMLDKRRQSAGMSYAQAFKTGAIIALYAGMLSPANQLIFHKLINPDYFQVMIEHTRNLSLAEGLDENEAMENAKAYFNLRSYIYQSISYSIIGGLIYSLILALIARRT